MEMETSFTSGIEPVFPVATPLPPLAYYAMRTHDVDYPYQLVEISIPPSSACHPPPTTFSKFQIWAQIRQLKDGGSNNSFADHTMEQHDFLVEKDEDSVGFEGSKDGALNVFNEISDSETEAANVSLLSVLRLELRGQPARVISHTTEVVMDVLSNNRLQISVKKSRIEKLLGVVPGNVFYLFLQIGGCSNGYEDGSGTTEDGCIGERRVVSISDNNVVTSCVSQAVPISNYNEDLHDAPNVFVEITSSDSASLAHFVALVLAHTEPIASSNPYDNNDLTNHVGQVNASLSKDKDPVGVHEAENGTLHVLDEMLDAESEVFDENSAQVEQLWERKSPSTNSPLCFGSFPPTLGCPSKDSSMKGGDSIVASVNARLIVAASTDSLLEAIKGTVHLHNEAVDNNAHSTNNFGPLSLITGTLVTISGSSNLSNSQALGLYYDIPPHMSPTMRAPRETLHYVIFGDTYVMDRGYKNTTNTLGSSSLSFALLRCYKNTKGLEHTRLHLLGSHHRSSLAFSLELRTDLQVFEEGLAAVEIHVSDDIFDVVSLGEGNRSMLGYMLLEMLSVDYVKQLKLGIIVYYTPHDSNYVGETHSLTLGGY